MTDHIIASGDVARLPDSLADARYTVDGVREALGARASTALDRNETAPGILELATVDTPLATMIRLWPLQARVSRTEAEMALPVDMLVSAGIVATAGDEVYAAIDIRPYADDSGDWWVAADLTPGLDGARDQVADDHVLGVNAASSTLAQLTVRRPTGRALDLGTGCGVQALHLARHCDQVVATDVNPRAVALARLTAELNGLGLDIREGDLFQPVADERFDLIVSNPPFVVSAGGHHVYRDSGLAGDELTRRVVIDGAERLNDGGMLQTLANWMHVRGEDWRDRVGAWVGGTRCDAWVIEREVLDPAEYVELWLRDSGDHGTPEYRSQYEKWLRWFDDHDVEGIGFGWVNLRASHRVQPTVKIESWRHAVAQPLGQTIERWFGAAPHVPSGTDLLPLRFTVADDVVQEQIGKPGEEHPEHIVLRQQSGLLRAIEAGTAEAGFVGACDGTLTTAALIDALASVLDVDPTELRDDLLPRIHDLALDGYLVPSA